MIRLYNVYPIKERTRFTKRSNWIRQGKWFIFQKHQSRVTHVKGLLLYETPQMHFIKYTWEEPNNCYDLWFLAKGMSNLKRTVAGYPEGVAYRPRQLIWLRADTTVTRRSAIKAEFFDLINATYKCDIEWRLHRKNRVVCAFDKSYKGGLKDGLLAMVKPYDISYDRYKPKRFNHPRNVIGETNVISM